MHGRSDLRTTILRGWYMYDWANSAFAVTILGALFGPYLDKVVVPRGGVDILALGIHGMSSTSLLGYSLGFAAFLVLLSSPVLGAIADNTASKKRFLVFFCAVGSVSTLLMFFVKEGDVVPALTLYIVSNFCFVSGNVFYDSFLPHIADMRLQDDVSATGYAYGYAGGGLYFLLSLLLVQFHEALGVPDIVLAMRIALAGSGLWWGGFALVTFRLVPEPAGVARAMSTAIVGDAFRKVFTMLTRIRSMKQMVLFLLAFMVYNDGIQTVIAMSTIYGSEELGFTTLTLMGCFLMVQAIGIFGARGFSWLADRIGTKYAVLLSLVIWSVITVYAFIMTRPAEFFVLGAFVGLVLGGSQALSRSLYSRMIPAAASAEFFGFFSVFEKFSAIGGPILFAFIRQTTGSSRYSILALVAFFVVGIVLLAFLNMTMAMKEKEKLAGAL